MEESSATRGDGLRRNSPMEMDPEVFKRAGYSLIDRIAGFLSELSHKPVTKGLSPREIRAELGEEPVPAKGASAEELLGEACRLLFENSLFNGHPRFWGYITSSATPMSALADLLAASVNANAGAFALSPVATEIEKQTIRWLAEFIGYRPGCGGVFVSGGNMANFTGFLAARKAKATGDIRKEGIHSALSGDKQLTVYCGKGTHTWVQKAADLFGHGTDSIRWIEENNQGQMNCDKLKEQIEADLAAGHTPFLVIANAGSVSSGAVDPLSEIAAICKNYDLWFHLDGAYGAPAAALPENANLFTGLSEADSIALDPHKWLYSALEAGCVLVRDPQSLKDAFSFQPEYYNFEGNQEEEPTNFYEYGLQNSRGFRALKVWLSLRQAGTNGYIEAIREDIALARQLFDLADQHDELEAFTSRLSITAFRYVPSNLPLQEREDYLNKLNETLLNRLQAGGEVFLSNASLEGKYCLRVCIVNFRTRYVDLKALVEVVAREGRVLARETPFP